jgi:hypothetical protein
MIMLWYMYVAHDCEYVCEHAYAYVCTQLGLYECAYDCVCMYLCVQYKEGARRMF